MKFSFIILLVLQLIACRPEPKPDRVKSDIMLVDSIRQELIERIAFGSCNHQYDDQSYWNVISSLDPDLWIWMGDNIYADTWNMSVMKGKYRRQKENPHYSAFISNIPVIGIWDDHDYGVNDGNKTFSKKEESKTLLLDFLEVDPEREVWDREGAYDSYTFGPAGKKIKFILLDTRSFKDELKLNLARNERYHPNHEGTLLGETQWEWLEDELQNDSIQLFVIVSSIQIIAREHPYEKWGNFPNERQRMLDLISEYDEKNILLLSGDRHLAEISKVELTGGKSLYEITASGLTHSFGENQDSNNFRVGPLVTVENFGILELDWGREVEDLKVRAKLYSVGGKVLHEERIQ